MATPDVKAIAKVAGILGELPVEGRRYVLAFLENAGAAAKIMARVERILEKLDDGARARVLDFFRAQLSA